jgi:hypothetical protein
MFRHVWTCMHMKGSHSNLHTLMESLRQRGAGQGERERERERERHKRRGGHKGKTEKASIRHTGVSQVLPVDLSLHAGKSNVQAIVMVASNSVMKVT